MKREACCRSAHTRTAHAPHRIEAPVCHAPLPPAIECFPLSLEHTLTNSRMPLQCFDVERSPAERTRMIVLFPRRSSTSTSTSRPRLQRGWWCLVMDFRAFLRRLVHVHPHLYVLHVCPIMVLQLYFRRSRALCRPSCRLLQLQFLQLACKIRHCFFK